MIKIEHLETCGWEAALRGMRNPKNSWDRSDSAFLDYDGKYYDISGEPIEDERVNDFKFDRVVLGTNDKILMSNLCKGGSVHAKFRRMIKVYCDITAPLYWWKEFDTYKIGTVANSCSTMHTLCDRPFELSDFSIENLYSDDEVKLGEPVPLKAFYAVLDSLNYWRNKYINSDDPDNFRVVKQKDIWRNLIQLLPSSYNQKRTIELNYEVLAGMYRDRKNHKLSEWIDLCSFMKDNLPYSWIFTGEYELRYLVDGVDRSNGATDASMTEAFINNFMKIQEKYRKAHEERM